MLSHTLTMHKRIPLLSLPRVPEAKTIYAKNYTPLLLWRNFIQHGYLEMCASVYLNESNKICLQYASRSFSVYSR